MDRLCVQRVLCVIWGEAKAPRRTIVKRVRTCVAVVGVWFNLAAYAVSPPLVGVDRAATFDDTCTESPMDATTHRAYHAWYGLWDGNDYRLPFAVGSVQEGVTTRFGTASQSVYRSGRARVTMRLDDAYGWDRSRIFRLVARSLASLPGPLMQRVPATVTLDLTQFRDEMRAHDTEPLPAYARAVCGYSAAAGAECSYGVVVPGNWFDLTNGRRPVPGVTFEKMLIHEFAHILDYASANLPWQSGACDGSTANPCPAEWSDADGWQAAMAQSPCAVSAYATTDAAEDFAESVVAWFGYYAGRQGRLEPSARSALRERLGKRFGVLNGLMHGRFDGE